MSEWYEIGGGGASTPKAGPFIRSLLLKDTKVDDDIADSVPFVGAAIGQSSQVRRITGVLRKTITADLVVRFRLQYPNGDLHTIGSFTLPSSTALKTAVPFLTFSWPTLPDLAVLIPDVTASDASKDKNGVAAFTIEYMGRGTGLPTAPGLGTGGAYDASTTYAAGDVVESGGNAYVSRADANTGHDPATSPDWWGLIATGGAVGPGVAAGGTTGQILKKNSGTDYDTAWETFPGVLSSRLISTTAPLTGGGDLSADRTLAISDMTGDSGLGGAPGAVPAPGVGDAAAGKFLKADATWAVPPAGVPSSRTISTTAPLTGGGDLSANRTLAISDFTGDTGAGGAKGAVPAPASGDAAAGKVLGAGGGWVAGGGGSGTVTHTGGALTSDQPVFGAGSADIKVGTKSGNTNEVATVTGALTSGHVLKADASGNVVDGGAVPTPDRLLIGFVINDGSTGTNVGPMLAAPHAGSITKCVIVTKASHATTDLTFTIKKNGVSVFSASPTVAAATASGTVTTSTSLTSSPLSVAADAVFSIDITSGDSAWKFSAQLE